MKNQIKKALRNILTEEKIYYYHQKPTSNGVRTTIMGVLKSGTFYLTASRCSNKDQFNKAKGRKQCEERMKQQKFLKTFKLSDISAPIFVPLAKEWSEKVSNNKKCETC
jgi:hypothetical protein